MAEVVAPLLHEYNPTPDPLDATSVAEFPAQIVVLLAIVAIGGGETETVNDAVSTQLPIVAVTV